jgi:hypothetical protein
VGWPWEDYERLALTIRNEETIVFSVPLAVFWVRRLIIIWYETAAINQTPAACIEHLGKCGTAIQGACRLVNILGLD